MHAAHNTLALALLLAPVTALAVPTSFVPNGVAVGPGWNAGRAADLNGDGFVDLLGVPNGVATEVQTAFGNGDGTFVDGPSSPIVSVICVDHQLADFNADGFPDWTCANVIGDSPIYLNNGDGTFALAASMPLTEGVGAGDVDGDGHLDAIAAGAGVVRIYLGDGAGGFSLDRTIDAFEAWDAEVADFDGDGIGELVLAAEMAGVHVYSYAADAVVDVIGARLTRFSSVADVDGDGNADIVVSNDSGAETWLNDGTGSFFDGGVGCGVNWLPSGYIQDIDGDGDLDLVDENNNDGGDTCLNDGAGVFTDGPTFASAGWRVSLGDFDGDGFPDVALNTADDAPTNIDLAVPELPPLPPLQAEAASDGTLITVDIAGADLLEGDVVNLGLSTAGLGDGPCWPALGGACMGILPPVFRVARVDIGGDLTGQVELTIPAFMRIGDTVALQPVAQRDGVVVLVGEAFELAL